jgi:hypothetical protein
MISRIVHLVIACEKDACLCLAHQWQDIAHLFPSCMFHCLYQAQKELQASLPTMRFCLLSIEPISYQESRVPHFGRSPHTLADVCYSICNSPHVRRSYGGNA